MAEAAGPVGAAVVGLEEAVDFQVEVPVAAGKNWAQAHLQLDSEKIISDAIAQAEAKTSAEIVPILVRQSTGYRHVPVILGLILFCVFLLSDMEGYFFSWSANLYWAMPLVLVACFFVSYPLSGLGWVRRLLTSPQDQRFESIERAELEFYRGKIQSTSNRQGVLLFLSLTERQVVVLADQGISKKLSNQTWDEISKLMVEEVKKGSLTQAFVRGIEKCSEILQKEFPSTTVQGENRLSNSLIIKE